MIRRQLPAYSPVSLPDLAAATFEAVFDAKSTQEALRTYIGRRFDAPWVHLIGSGTDALRVALGIAGVVRPRGGAVALPSYSCYDLVTAAVGARSRVVFYDIDPVSLTPDLDSLKRALEFGATTVVAGCLFGFPLNWPEISAECRRAGALLVADAAQGLGSGWRGREAATFGDLTVLSFGRGKGWTGGGGGALLLRDPELEAALGAASQSQPWVSTPGASTWTALLTLAQWGLGRPEVYGLVAALPLAGLGETRYKEPQVPSMIPSFCAAAAMRSAEPSVAVVASRRDRARVWEEILFSDGQGERKRHKCAPLRVEECGFLRYPLLVPGEAREALIRRASVAGAARGYPVALPDLPQAQSAILATVGAFPGSRALAAGLVTLPTHSMVSELDWAVFRSIPGP